MNIYAINIPANHPSLEVLGRFGETQVVSSWPPAVLVPTSEPSLIFVRLDDGKELSRISQLCEERGDWCFVWADDHVLSAIAQNVSSSLVDFVSGDFDETELVIRMVRLLRLEKPAGGGNFLGVPDEIADELTKKQLVILKALFEAGEFGLSKDDISSKIWRKTNTSATKASGFNVHVLHLRRKLEKFGLMVTYDKHDKVYRLRAAVKPRQPRRRPVIAPLASSEIQISL